MRKPAIIVAVLAAPILMLAFVLAVRPLNTQARSAALITVSGTITGPGGPVSGVWISVGSPEDWSGMTTGANGFYSLSLQTSGQVWINVRPDVATHVAQANVWRDGVTMSFTRNFTLTTGHLLSLRFTGGGAPVMLEQAGAQVTYCEDEVGHKVSVACPRALRDFFSD